MNNAEAMLMGFWQAIYELTGEFPRGKLAEWVVSAPLFDAYSDSLITLERLSDVTPIESDPSLAFKSIKIYRDATKNYWSIKLKEKQ